MQVFKCETCEKLEAVLLPSVVSSTDVHRAHSDLRRRLPPFESGTNLSLDAQRLRMYSLRLQGGDTHLFGSLI